jgi:uncharacterized OsmC-like protein
MLGTLNGALEVRRVQLPPDGVEATAEGFHAIRDGLPVLTRVHVHYRLRIPAGTRESVERALARHQDKCPTAATLLGAVEVGWTADIAEV